MPEDFDLLFFGPALVGHTVVAEFRFGAEFAHEDQLLRKEPLNFVGVFGSEFIPADVFILADSSSP